MGTVGTWTKRSVGLGDPWAELPNGWRGIDRIVLTTCFTGGEINDRDAPCLSNGGIIWGVGLHGGMKAHHHTCVSFAGR